MSNGNVIPGELAPMGHRTAAFAIEYIGFGLISAIPVIGWFVGKVLLAVNLILFRRGRDIGARIIKLRVVRDTGELAGFYQMWTRTLASVISITAIGAGYWTAYWDRDSQTWHDKILGTYVITDDGSLNEMETSSSVGAKIVFWITAPILVLGIVMTPLLIFVG